MAAALHRGAGADPRRMAGFANCRWAWLVMMAFLTLPPDRPAWAGPPFVTDDPEPVGLGHWEVYAFSSGAIDPHEASGVGPSVEINYGALPGLQLHILGNLAYHAAGNGTQFGIGDTELGAKYRFVTPGPHDWFPQIAVFPALELPTGNAHRALGAGTVQAFLPIWLQKSFGVWTADWGAGYWINPGAGNRNYWLVGWLLRRQVTDKLSLGGEVFHQTSSAVGSSGTNGLNFGAQYDIDDHHHLLVSAGRRGMPNGVDGATANRGTIYYIGHQWTF